MRDDAGCPPSETMEDFDRPQESGRKARTNSGYYDTSVQPQLIHAMGAARRDPGRGGSPYEGSKPLTECPERTADAPVRGVEDKY